MHNNNHDHYHDHYHNENMMLLSLEEKLGVLQEGFEPTTFGS